MQEVWSIVHEAGVIRDILVAVAESNQRPGVYTVQLMGTIDGFSDIGDPFIGIGAKANAVVFANKLFSALEVAELSWFEDEEAGRA